jgi:polyhydroxybutyrate depolymerase
MPVQIWEENYMSVSKVLRWMITLIMLCTVNSGFALADMQCGLLPSGNTKLTVTIEGLVREYYVYVPPGTYRNSPAMILFHGGGGTAPGIEAATHMNYHADKNKFIAVYPEGYKNHWDDGRVVPGRKNVADLAFVAQIMQTLVTQFYVDPTRIYTVGFSDGGLFNERLTFVMREKIAAAAFVCAPETRVLIAAYGPSHPPLPVLYMLGTSDPLMNWFSGPIHCGNVISADETVEKWVTANGCIRPPTVHHLANINTSDGSYVVLDYFANPLGDRSNDVAFYKIIGGGHRWPGGDIKQPSNPNIPPLGNTNEDIDASQVIWDFLSRHSKG